MGDDLESPQREIFLDAYYIDRFEVTTSRYTKFLAATGSVAAPDGWDALDPDERRRTSRDWRELERRRRRIANGRGEFAHGHRVGKSGARQRTAAIIRGATRCRRLITQTTKMPRRNPITAGLEMWAPIRAGRSQFGVDDMPATSPSGSRIGIPKVSLIANDVIPKGRKPERNAWYAAAGGSITPIG